MNETLRESRDNIKWARDWGFSQELMKELTAERRKLVSNQQAGLAISMCQMTEKPDNFEPLEAVFPLAALCIPPWMQAVVALDVLAGDSANDTDAYRKSVL